MVLMRTFALLLASLALGCASSSGVSSLHDGTAPGSPFQLVGAGIPDQGRRMPPALGSEFMVDFLVVLSNVSDGELYLDNVSVSSIGDRTVPYSFNPVRTQIDRMIEEDEDIDVEFVLRMTKIQRMQAGKALPIRIVANLRDGTGYAWSVEIPSWNLP